MSNWDKDKDDEILLQDRVLLRTSDIPGDNMINHLEETLIRKTSIDYIDILDLDSETEEQKNCRRTNTTTNWSIKLYYRLKYLSTHS